MGAWYRSVETWGNHLLHRYTDEKGKRRKEKGCYHPYLFAEKKIPIDKVKVHESDLKTLIGNKPLYRYDFPDMKLARLHKDFLESKGIPVHGMELFGYAFIHDKYPGEVPFEMSRLRVGYLDIECDSEGGFPNIARADKKITAISVRCNGQTVCFALGDYDNKDPSSVMYRQYETEKELLKEFLAFWRQIDLDILSGWNCEFFDIPYLANRILRLLGMDAMRKLSPWDIMKEKRAFIKGREQMTYVPLGIAVLDYMDLYVKFAYTRAGQDSFKESKALNYIANKELGEKKLDYSEYASLQDLYRKDHQKFIDYNIRDCYLVDKLDQKLKFIELVCRIAYGSKVNLVDALTSVRLWDVTCYHYLMDRGIVCPPISKEDRPPVEYEGGWCKEPKPGAYDWVISFDVQSEYPNTIIQYNISPETFLGQIHRLSIDELLKGDQRSYHQKLSIAANGTAYRKDIQGFIPALMEKLFAQRAEYKQKMKEAVSEDEKLMWDGYQMATKIMLNSAYGAIGNRYFRYHDVNLAEAVTKSGRLAIRWVIKAVNKKLNEVQGSKDIDYVIAGDTDSMMIHGDVLMPVDVEENGDPVAWLDDYAKTHIEPAIKEAFEDLAAYMGAYKNAMRMQRETISDRAIWLGKKHYIMDVVDREGERFREPKIKVKGMEAVRSSTPEICRKAIIEVIGIILKGTEADTRKFISEFKSTFCSSPFEDIAKNSSANGIEKWADPNRSYKSGAPIHIKAVLNFNKLLREKGLDEQIEPIYSSSKIKWAFLKEPNPTGHPTIAAPSFLPPELELHSYIDYDEQFSKCFLDPIRRITKVLHWDIDNLDTLDDWFV